VVNASGFSKAPRELVRGKTNSEKGIDYQTTSIFFWGTTMNILSFAHEVPNLREAQGFSGFCFTNSRDGILRTGLHAHVTKSKTMNDEIKKIADVAFPGHFARRGDNMWVHPGFRLIIKKTLDDDFTVLCYDTSSGFEADARVCTDA
jgi:hypothetical protein